MSGYRTYGSGVTDVVYVKGIAPTISGPAVIDLAAGYASGNTRSYAIGGGDFATTGIATNVSVSGIAGASVTSAGLLTIPLGLAPGNYTATVTASNGVAGGASITVTVNVTGTAIPQTGDQTSFIWVTIFAAFASAAALFVVRQRRKASRGR